MGRPLDGEVSASGDDSPGDGTIGESGDDGGDSTIATDGGCGTACGAAQGNCRAFYTSPSCTSSPSPACGSGTVSCTYPGTTETICLIGSVCPS